MSQGVSEFLAAAATAVRRQDGPALAAMLSPDAVRPRAVVEQCLRDAPHADLGALASAQLPPPYDEVMALHCRLLAFLQSKPDDACAPRPTPRRA